MNEIQSNSAPETPRMKTRRSQLAWRLALVLFTAVLAIEAVIFVPSFLSKEQELLTEIKSEAVNSIAVLLMDHEDTTTSTLSVHRKLIFERTPIVGFVVYRDNWAVVASAGEPVELRPSQWQYALNQPLKRVEQGQFVDVFWTPADLNAPYYAAARLNTAQIDGALQSYSLHILILTLLIASVATISILVALDKMVLKPVLALHGAVVGAAQDVSEAHIWTISDTGVGEIGELTLAINEILRTVSENFRSLRRNNEELVAESQRRLEAEKQAGTAHKRLLEAIEAFPGGFAVFDTDDRLALSNATYREYYPASAELMKPGVCFTDMVRAGVSADRQIGKYARGAYWLRDRIAEPQAGLTDSERLLATGRWVHIRERRTEDGDIVSVWSDISDRKTAESERREIQQQFFHAQKTDALGTLAGGVAHDFNNLLAIILGNAKLLELDIAPGAAGREELDAISNAGNRAKNLVKQILTFARQDTGDQEAVDLREITQETLSLITATMPKSIKTEGRLSGSATIVGDPTQIHQVIMNLCINARDAIGDATGEILVELDDRPPTRDWPDEGESNTDASTAEQRIKFSHDHRGSYLWMGQPPNGQSLCLIVSDTGPGIEPEIFERIFDPFFTTKEVGKGTGLGLAAMQGIIRSHGGALYVETIRGQGTRFEISFPQAPAAALPRADRSMIEHRATGTILVLDDEPDIVSMLRKSLERKGYMVDGMSDAEAALSAVKQSPDRWSVIISDINMPRLSGTEFARAVRDIRPTLPIILCTGSLNIMPAGDDLADLDLPVIQKPIQDGQLFETIQQSILISKKGKNT
jgi:signal transduction histidine kinase/ActR/RegA family two-component response regulator